MKLLLLLFQHSPFIRCLCLGLAFQSLLGISALLFLGGGRDRGELTAGSGVGAVVAGVAPGVGNCN